MTFHLVFALILAAIVLFLLHDMWDRLKNDDLGEFGNPLRRKQAPTRYWLYLVSTVALIAVCGLFAIRYATAWLNTP